MSNRFIKQSQCAIVGIFATAALMGLGACSDDYDLDEKGNNPSWKILRVRSLVLSTLT